MSNPACQDPRRRTARPPWQTGFATVAIAFQDGSTDDREEVMAHDPISSEEVARLRAAPTIHEFPFFGGPYTTPYNGKHN